MATGIDIGGANTKAARHDAGFTFNRYVPIWDTTDIEDPLREIYGLEGNNEKFGIVVTAELADCFESKRQGLAWVERSVKKIIPDALFFGYDGTFHDSMEKSGNFAGANWMASASLIAQEFDDAIFIDIGSTTTDIIPITGGKVRGRHTDMERLGSSQLVYSGVQRTNVATKLSRVLLNGRKYRTASELFATTLDAYVLLGEVGYDELNCETADGKNADPLGCARRLSRVVCSDLGELGMDNVLAIAEQVREAQAAERQPLLLKSAPSRQQHGSSPEQRR